MRNSTRNNIKINTHAKYPCTKYFGERAAEEIIWAGMIALHKPTRQA